MMSIVTLFWHFETWETFSDDTLCLRCQAPYSHDQVLRAALLAAAVLQLAAHLL